MKPEDIKDQEQKMQEEESTPVISMDDILSVFKNYSDKKRMKDLKTAVVNLFRPDGELLWPPTDNIEKQVEALIKTDKRLDKESYLTYSNGYYKKRPNKKAVSDPSTDSNIPTEYVGRAGETAVMSELMFRGYNANRMMIDEGVDIIAVKDNIYYYIQVKTVSIKGGKVHCQIPINRFDQYIGSQIRYFVVARYIDKGEERNRFFMFTNSDLDKYVYDRCVKRGDTAVSIKIGFDEHTGKPFLYDVNKVDISWHMNRFTL